MDIVTVTEETRLAGRTLHHLITFEHAGQAVREPCSNAVGTFRQEMDIVLVGRGFLNTSA